MPGPTPALENSCCGSECPLKLVLGGEVVIGHGAALCWWGTTATSFLVLSGFLIGGSTLAVPLKVPFYSHFQTHKPCFKFQEKH